MYSSCFIRFRSCRMFCRWFSSVVILWQPIWNWQLKKMYDRFLLRLHCCGIAICRYCRIVLCSNIYIPLTFRVRFNSINQPNARYRSFFGSTETFPLKKHAHTIPFYWSEWVTEMHSSYLIYLDFVHFLLFDIPKKKPKTYMDQVKQSIWKNWYFFELGSLHRIEIKCIYKR